MRASSPVTRARTLLEGQGARLAEVGVVRSPPEWGPGRRGWRNFRIGKPPCAGVRAERNRDGRSGAIAAAFGPASAFNTSVDH